MQELDGSMGGESGQINSKRRTERWIYKWEGAEGWELGETRRRSRGEHLVRNGEIQKWRARLAAPVTELPFARKEEGGLRGESGRGMRGGCVRWGFDWG